jgi:hypothetical protein
MSPPLFVVAETPALLAGMPYPEPETDWNELHRRGFRRLVRLHPGDYDAAPLVVHDVALEDLFGGRSPEDPEAEGRRVWEAALLAADFVARGEGVLVHCVGGTGRTGTVLACALRRLGRPADEAIRLVRSHRPHWPESSWQEDIVRRIPEVP